MNQGCLFSFFPVVYKFAIQPDKETILYNKSKFPLAIKNYRNLLIFIEFH